MHGSGWDLGCEKDITTADAVTVDPYTETCALSMARVLQKFTKMMMQIMKPVDAESLKQLRISIRRYIYIYIVQQADAETDVLQTAEQAFINWRLYTDDVWSSTLLQV